MLKSFIPYAAVALTMAVAVTIHSQLVRSVDATVKTEGQFDFVPNWRSDTNSSATPARQTSPAGTNEIVPQFKRLIPFTNSNGKTLLRPQKFVEGHLRASAETVAVPLVLGALVSWLTSIFIIWKLSPSKPSTMWLAILGPAVAALGVGFFYSSFPGNYLHFTDQVLTTLSEKAAPLPDIHWLVLSHAIAFGCALIFCSVSAMIIYHAASPSTTLTLAGGGTGSALKVPKAATLSKYLEWILYLGTVVLALCVLFEKTIYDWVGTFYSDEAQREAYRTLVGSLLVATGLLGSLFIAGYYIPAAVAVSRLSGAPEFKMTKLKNVFAVTGPLIVGGLAKFVELLGLFDL